MYQQVEKLKSNRQLVSHSDSRNKNGEGSCAPLVDNRSENGELVQRAKRRAQVVWETTHLVKVQDDENGESLFGKDDWQSGEVQGKSGQLSYGQPIIVDDEALFMSRRGANQENSLRREEDRDTDELKHKWLKVLAIWVGDKFEAAPKDAYVRAETIKLEELEKPPRKTITLNQHGSEDEKVVSADLTNFHKAWQVAAKKRRRSTGQVVKDFAEPITSGWNWDQYDEGVDVSSYMKDPDERATFDGVSEQHILSANYETEGGKEPIAYMVLEVRTDEDEPYMYIRWLIAHPEKGGGGSALVKNAISRFKAQKEFSELRVESAFSAVGWYESMGFEKLNPGKNVVTDIPHLF